MHRVRRATGFTLIEVLVALVILGVVAAMAWRGVDGIVRARDLSEQRLEQQLRLQSVIAQWETDLAEVQDSGVVPALQWDGASLRLTRRSAQGLQLVVWALRGNGLTRWASEPVTRSAALQEVWMRSQQLLGNEAGQLRALGGIAAAQLYFWRNNGWSNAQSSGDVLTPTPSAQAAGLRPREALPGGVRLVLSFAEGSGSAGTLTRDVRLGPQGPQGP
jgi:general secretion pathway protein J